MTILTAKQVWQRRPVLGSHIARLTDKQSDNAKAALRFLRARHGHKRLATMLGVSRNALSKTLGTRRASPRMMFLTAHVAGVGVDAIMFGLWPGDRCPHCDGTGRRR